ncbi:MAG: sigma-54-dependent Fis family transcriptional regulator, partial [Aliifodinibius sp.]|nr:sigma-54-dependent Fis family transcriptional regulator [Fodinibius sp.]NIV09798.1 sigma-54-dependent Fis family transcriptional regulator [Fodinibius sp.]NIY23328.1 sigma-54-dependent Fis family transcriptional regulator [Fodinibius sp.]
FTGASETRDGKFLQADGGTLFLDEIADMSLKVQTKVLRALQDGQFERVGGKSTMTVDVRVIAATNRDLDKMVAQGKFREDLYYRLNVLPISAPPLRERRDDIPLLLEYFIKKYCFENNRRLAELSDDANSILRNYPWPGNIRELKNLVERLLIMNPGEKITASDLPSHLTQPDLDIPSIKSEGKTLKEVRDMAEREYILQA